MKILKVGIYLMAIAIITSMGSCSKDDSMDDMTTGGGNSGGGGGTGGGDTTMVIQNMMCWKVNGEVFAADTVVFSNTGRAHNFDGKPTVGFIPGLGITIKPERPVGEWNFAVNGEIENASFSDANANIFIAQSGSLKIVEHKVGEYIKAEFEFVGKHTQNTLPDVVVTEGVFETKYSL